MTNAPQANNLPAGATPPRNITEEIRSKGGGARAIPNSPFSIFNLEGFIQTVTVVPTAAPKTFYESIKIYTDDIGTPTVRRLYIYSLELNDWLYVALST